MPRAALCYGTPMGVEIEEHGPGALDRVFEDGRRGLRAHLKVPNGFDAPMSAHIVTAVK